MESSNSVFFARRCSPCAIFLSLLLCHFAERYALGAQEEDGLKERMLSEAPRKWHEYHSFAKRLQGSMMITNEYMTPARRPGKPARWEFKQNERCALVSIKDAVENPRPGQATSEVYAINPFYGFQLKGGNRGNEWVVTGIEQEKKDDIQWAGIPVSEMVSRCFMLPFAVYGRQLDMLFAEPDFKVGRVALVNREGEDLVQFEFEFPPHPDEKQFYPIQRGSVYLDPTRYWCVREYELRGKWENWATIKRINYFKEIQGYPVLTRAVERHKYDPSKGPDAPTEFKGTQDFEFDDPSQLPPDEEFTLSAFGLPEPFGVKKAKSRWYLWAAGAGMTCLIVGVVIRRLSRRGV